VYSEELFNSLKGITIKNITREMGGVDLAQAGVDYDDLEQQCRIWLWEACRQYKPESGMKFHNFYWMKIASKLGNFRNKFQRAERKGRVKNFTAIGEQFWGIVGLEDTGHGDDTRGHYGSYVKCVYESTEVINSVIEAKKVASLLNSTERTIYNDHFILGKTIPEILENVEIKKNNKPLKYYQISKIIKDLKGIHETIIMGELC
jgi:DNA-directed RNA polymerase specialized sigma subunit